MRLSYCLRRCTYVFRLLLRDTAPQAIRKRRGRGIKVRKRRFFIFERYENNTYDWDGGVGIAVNAGTHLSFFHDFDGFFLKPHICRYSLIFYWVGFGR